MFLLIDGYNLFKVRFESRMTESVYKDFVTLIDLYSRAKGHRACIVFDGYQLAGLPMLSLSKQTTVVFAQNYSADEWIIRYIEKNVQREYLLVSSDRRLQEAVARSDIVSIGSPEFWKVLSVFDVQRRVDKKKKMVSVQELSKKKEPTFDELMDEASYSIEYKDEWQEVSRNKKNGVKGEKDKRSERRLVRIIKKL